MSYYEDATPFFPERALKIIKIAIFFKIITINSKNSHSRSTQRGQGVQVSQLFVFVASVHHLQMQDCHEIPVPILPAPLRPCCSHHPQIVSRRSWTIPEPLLCTRSLSLHAAQHAAPHEPSALLPLRQGHHLPQEEPPHQATRGHVPSAPQHPGAGHAPARTQKGRLNKEINSNVVNTNRLLLLCLLCSAHVRLQVVCCFDAQVMSAEAKPTPALRHLHSCPLK